MPRVLLPVLLLLLAPLAGCIDVPRPDDRDDAASWAAAAEPPAERIQGMTADETHEDSVGRCEGNGISVPPRAYCAQRVLTATGRIGVDRLPVELFGGNGAITLTTGAGDAWSLTATVKTRGLTEDEARRALDEDWSWSHEDGQGGHRLRAAPTGAVPLLVGSRVEGTVYVVSLPAWVVLDLKAETTNGAIVLDWGDAERVDVSTTNGAVVLHGRAADAHASTTNGGIEADLRATASGAWSLSTTNGGIRLGAPEDARRGYDLDATTTNGRINILLLDGHVDAQSRTRQTFRTEGYDARAIQTTVKLETTTGGIVAG
jgi:prepilin-type processing-associated H-X9-DG protein